MLWTTIQVALGGAIGAALRFLLGSVVVRHWTGTFPVAILGVNVLGSFLMGLCVVWAAKTANAHLSPFLMTGVLGGFTTFSAFSLEAYTLFERGQTAAAAGYVAASVVFSIAGLVAGVMLARGVMA